MKYLTLKLWAILTVLVCSFCVMANTTSNIRYATLDWTVAETLVALGEQPVATGDLTGYARWVSEPKLTTTFNLGLRNQPNPEQLFSLVKQSSDPVHFINSSFYATNTALLQQFGAVTIVDFYKEGNSWENILTATKQIAQQIGKEQRYEQLMAEFEQKITKLAQNTDSYTQRPVALVQFSDSRHLRIYAENSPFGEILKRLGFKNAWQGEYNIWGMQNIDIAQLAKLPKNTRLIVVKPYPADIKIALKHNTLWQHLDLAKDAVVLPAVWTFGGVPSAQRFAELLVQALENGGEQW